MLGPAGEHPIGFVDATGDEVVDENTDIRFLARQNHRLASRHGKRRVGPRHDPLRRGLLVAGGAVDLPGEEEARRPLALQRQPQLLRRTVVVFHRIAPAHDLGCLQARHHPDHGILHIAWQAGGDAVDVDLLRPAPLRLEEELVAVPIGETHDLVFDARAVARAARFDLAGIHRGTMEIGPDQGMDLGGGARDPARELRLLDGVRQKRKGLRLGIPRLDLELRKID